MAQPYLTVQLLLNSPHLCVLYMGVETKRGLVLNLKGVKAFLTPQVFPPSSGRVKRCSLVCGTPQSYRGNQQANSGEHTFGGGFYFKVLTVNHAGIHAGGSLCDHTLRLVCPHGGLTSRTFATTVRHLSLFSNNR